MTGGDMTGGGSGGASGAETVLTPHLLRDWPLPAPGGGKEGRGRVIVVGGSRATPGAVRLAGEGALRSGAGKLQIVTAESVAPGLAIHIPESKAVGLPEREDGELAAVGAETIIGLAKSCDAVVLGPGIGDTTAATDLLEEVLPRLETTLVLDALGMAYVTEHPDGLEHLGGRVVLSPNPKELSRTLGVDQDDVEADTPAHVTELARRARAVVVSGTSTSWIATPDGRLWRDESGSFGLGVSGSGDVKAGIIAGLLARGADPAQAAAWATYSHGRAGERLSARTGPTGFLARELLPEVPGILVELSS